MPKGKTINSKKLKQLLNEIEKINELPNSNNNNNHNSNVIPNRKKLFLPELHNNYNYQLPVINNINISMRKHPNTR